MTEDNQNIDMHHTAKLAVFNRVSPPENLSATRPKYTIDTIPNSEFLCNTAEHVKQRLNYITLVSRIVTKHIKCLEDFSDEVVKHIPHAYSKEMRKKSENVSDYFIFQFF